MATVVESFEQSGPEGQCLNNPEWSASGRRWSCRTELEDQEELAINLFVKNIIKLKNQEQGFNAETSKKETGSEYE